jgi:hypothetical protein
LARGQLQTPQRRAQKDRELIVWLTLNPEHRT